MFALNKQDQGTIALSRDDYLPMIASRSCSTAGLTPAMRRAAALPEPAVHRIALARDQLYALQCFLGYVPR